MFKKNCPTNPLICLHGNLVPFVDPTCLMVVGPRQSDVSFACGLSSQVDSILVVHACSLSMLARGQAEHFSYQTSDGDPRDPRLTI
jgi:hypothetical protein